MLCKTLGIIHVFIPRQTAVHSLAQQIAHRQLHVLPPRIRQVFADEFAQSEALIQLSRQEQSTVGSHS
jgi:hypothetical protein